MFKTLFASAALACSSILQASAALPSASGRTLSTINPDDYRPKKPTSTKKEVSAVVCAAVAKGDAYADKQNAWVSTGADF
jgi:hypothetical protein